MFAGNDTFKERVFFVLIPVILSIIFFYWIEGMSIHVILKSWCIAAAVKGFLELFFPPKYDTGKIFYPFLIISLAYTPFNISIALDVVVGAILVVPVVIYTGFALF